MSKHATKYYHKEMDRTAGIEHTYHRTKIVATVGPACDTYEKLLELVKCGVNVFRLNFSHGGHDDKTQIIEFIREINKKELPPLSRRSSRANHPPRLERLCGLLFFALVFLITE